MNRVSLAIFAVLFALAACNRTPVEPPEPTLSGTVEDWDQGAATVSADLFDADGNVVFTFAEGEVGADGRFSLALPESVPAAQLSETTAEGFGCATAGVTVSTGSYRSTGFGELSVTQGDASLGYLSLSSSYSFAAYEGNAVGDVFVSHEYADRAVTLTGECTFQDGAQDTFEMSLQPGWNTVNYTVTGVTPEGDIASGVFRTGMPGGVQWFFVPAAE